VCRGWGGWGNNTRSSVRKTWGAFLAPPPPPAGPPPPVAPPPPAPPAAPWRRPFFPSGSPPYAGRLFPVAAQDDCVVWGRVCCCNRANARVAQQHQQRHRTHRPCRALASPSRRRAAGRQSRAPRGPPSSYPPATWRRSSSRHRAACYCPWTGTSTWWLVVAAREGRGGAAALDDDELQRSTAAMGDDSAMSTVATDSRAAGASTVPDLKPSSSSNSPAEPDTNLRQ